MSRLGQPRSPITFAALPADPGESSIDVIQEVDLGDVGDRWNKVEDTV
jgi:hypothetical protein